MANCRWCETPFPDAVIGGRQQKYCRPTCRAKFNTALRRYAAGLIRAEFLSTRDLRLWHDRNVHVEENSNE